MKSQSKRDWKNEKKEHIPYQRQDNEIPVTNPGKTPA